MRYKVLPDDRRCDTRQTTSGETEASILRERGEFDPDNNLGHRLVAEHEPLIAAEHLEHMAIGEVLARHYRHPTKLDDAAKAGATWEQIGAARGTSAEKPRQDYRAWADGQHDLLTWTEGRIGTVSRSCGSR